MEQKQEIRLAFASLAAYVVVAIVVILAFAAKGRGVQPDDCSIGASCKPDGISCPDENNRSLECANGAFRLAKPCVFGQSCDVKGDSCRDACGQTLFCDASGFWADTLGNRVCLR